MEDSKPPAMAPSMTDIDWQFRRKIFGDDPVPLSKLILAATTSSGSARSDAESLFYSLSEPYPGGLTIRLLVLIQDFPCSDLRARAAGLLRTLFPRFSKPPLWNRLRYEHRCSLRYLLVEILCNEESRSVLEQLLPVVVYLGSDLLPYDEWPGLIFFMFQAMVCSSTRLRESGLFLFSHLACYIESSSLPPLPTLRSILLYSLAYTDSADEMDVKFAALPAAISFIHCTPSSDRERLVDLLPHMVSVMIDAFTGNQEELAKEALGMLAFLVGIEPLFFCWPELVEIMLQIAEFDGLDEELRRGVVNLLVSLAKEPGIANMKFIVFDYCTLIV